MKTALLSPVLNIYPHCLIEVQWGYMFKTGDSNAVFTYPIKFSSRVVFADYFIKIKNAYQGQHSLGEFTNTSLTINMSKIFESDLYFLVIGY